MNEELKMTDEECDLLNAKTDAIGELLTDTPAIIVLHAACRIIADIGAQNSDRMTKREFVADVVECLDFWMPYYQEEYDDE